MRGQLPVHIAIIMDGNGRWAKRRGLPRYIGHREGVRRVEDIVEVAREIGIKFLTLFAFSTENWQRPEEEVHFLMKLFSEYLDAKKERMIEEGIRFNAIGRLDMLPADVKKRIEDVMNSTRHLDDMVLNIAVSYGGRAEIVDAAKRIAARVSAGDISIEDIDEDLFSKFLYAPWIPDPDLLIRTSGEMRISNFFLWELAYTELYITDVLWPDFGKEEFMKAIEDFKRRERRFGRVEPSDLY